jgi:lysophospholipid hydrolase
VQQEKLAIYTGVRSDFSRLSRRLLSRSIGLVLGGGGAKGLAHVGVIRALEEAGIPIDMVGGTSIGAFVSGLYARENDHVSVFGRTKSICTAMASTWRTILDLTYPITAMTTGNEFNRGIWGAFGDSQIEDCWLPYFAVTTNITYSREEVHQQGYIWRYVRASMSLSGYLPPICDNGSMLMDGGYLNNVPADVIRKLGAQVIIAVDVGGLYSTAPVTYGDSLSGWWLLLYRLNPFGKNYGQIPPLSEIQGRLAYASSVSKLEEITRLEGVHYMVPEVQKYGLMEFHRFAEIEKVGYDYMKAQIQKWSEDGTLLEQFGVKNFGNSSRRRQSI